jgi:hypothetical protein
MFQVAIVNAMRGLRESGIRYQKIGVERDPPIPDP